MKGMVSVLIPVFNRQDLITECVNSVLEQSWQNLEVILVDDGSEDRTLEVCRELERSDDRIRVLVGPHAGVSAARNLGLEALRGEYAFFLDSDDVIHPQVLETLIRGLEQTDAGIAGVGVRSVRQERWYLVQERLNSDPEPAETEYHCFEQALHQMMRRITPINLIGGVMMRSSLIGDTRFRSDLHIGEDYQFVYENLAKGTAAVFLENKWYYSRLHAGNSSWDYSVSGFWTRFYRRMLVWRNEEACGRKENANCQKREAAGIVGRFMLNFGPRSADSKKIRQMVRPYFWELSEGLSLRGKVILMLVLWAPGVYAILHRTKQKF